MSKPSRGRGRKTIRRPGVKVFKNGRRMRVRKSWSCPGDCDHLTVVIQEKAPTALAVLI